MEVRTRKRDLFQKLLSERLLIAGFLVILLATAVLVDRTLPFNENPFAGHEIYFQLIVAAFVVSVLRNEVGVTTYGVFGPVALAFVLQSTNLFWGLVLVFNLMIVALATYFVLEPARIGTAHRVATMLMVAALLMILIQHLGETGSLPSILASEQLFFPAIITAWYADRMGREIRERGWTIPSIHVLWTVVAIVVSYLVISAESFIEWFMLTPAAWVGLIAANVILGAFVNIRIKEYHRFSDFFDEMNQAERLSILKCKLHNAKASVLGVLSGSVMRKRAVDFLPINLRNRYIKKLNPRFVRGTTGKASAKRTFHALDIPTPETYFIIEELSDLSDASSFIEENEGFVIKPDDSYGGEGIVVVDERNGTQYETSKGTMTAAQLEAHIRSILQGQYAEMGLDGTAIIEEQIHPAPVLQSVSGQGVPDIRVIVFKGYPILSMTRLPTEDSGGAANIHLGAVAVGLSIARGRSHGGYHQASDSFLDSHPDTGRSLTDFSVPNWGLVLRTAVRAAGTTKLGYVGVDIVLDERRGPVVLEVNVQPGLGIQNATMDGILTRMQFIESLPQQYEFKSVSERVELAQSWDNRSWEVDG